MLLNNGLLSYNPDRLFICYLLASTGTSHPSFSWDPMVFFSRREEQEFQGFSPFYRHTKNPRRKNRGRLVHTFLFISTQFQVFPL